MIVRAIDCPISRVCLLETVLLFVGQGRAPRVFRELPNPVTAITRTLHVQLHARCISRRMGTGSREKTRGMGLDP